MVAWAVKTKADGEPAEMNFDPKFFFGINDRDVHNPCVAKLRICCEMAFPLASHARAVAGNAPLTSTQLTGSGIGPLICQCRAVETSGPHKTRGAP